MAKILDYANDISFNRFTRIRRSISNAGFAVSQKGSPTFYGMEVNLRPLTKSQFDEVEAELIGLDDGILPLSTTIPSNVVITNLQSTNTVSGLTVTSGTGNSVILNDVSNLAIGDYVQFSTGTKVYQIKTVTTATNTIVLNTSLINAVPGTPTTNVATGKDVNFKLLLEATPSVTIIPGPGYNYYQYGAFNFREVL